MDERIVGIQVFEFDVPSCFHYDQGKMVNCRYGLLKITSSGQTGWGACIMSINEPHFDLIKWSTFLFKLRKLTIAEALITITAHKSLWGKVKTELVEKALLDLAAPLQRKKLSTDWLQADEYLESSRLSPLLQTGFGKEFQLDSSLLLEESQAYFAVI